MAVFRVEKTKDFTIMCNHHLRNTELSLKAKGLLSLMLSLPDNWDYTTKGLSFICKDGVDSISTALKELERHGYLTRQRLRYENGQLGDIEYCLSTGRSGTRMARSMTSWQAWDIARKMRSKKKPRVANGTYSHRLSGLVYCADCGARMGYISPETKHSGNSFDEPKQWEIREINEIMNNSIEGWTAFTNPRIFAKYGRQRGWERAASGNEQAATGSDLPDGFRELTEEEARQMELPF